MLWSRIQWQTIRQFLLKSWTTLFLHSWEKVFIFSFGHDLKELSNLLQLWRSFLWLRKIRSITNASGKRSRKPEMKWKQLESEVWCLHPIPLSSLSLQRSAEKVKNRIKTDGAKNPFYNGFIRALCYQIYSKILIEWLLCVRHCSR